MPTIQHIGKCGSARRYVRKLSAASAASPTQRALLPRRGCHDERHRVRCRGAAIGRGNGAGSDTPRRGSAGPAPARHAERRSAGALFRSACRRAEIIALSHPGFGHSARPADFDTVYDLVHLYLDVLDTLPYERVTLVGLSFGGWLVAEIAVKCCHR